MLTVHPDYYEETPDWSLCKTVSSNVEVIHVKAWKVMKPRFFGDIGLRSFFFLYQKALGILKERKIDFIWIPIPSYYTSLLGRLLHERTSVPYGIDYIDPWIRETRGRRYWRNMLSNIMARILEPIAIKKCSMVSGVAESYYLPALKRNFKHSQIISSDVDVRSVNIPIDKRVTHLAFPYGFDPLDHELHQEEIELPWKGIVNCKPLIYTGAFMPQSQLFIETLFKCIRQLSDVGEWDNDVHLFFLGTGRYVGKRLKNYAEEAGIGHLVNEVRDRLPFLTTLRLQAQCFGVMVIGSTEKHYTASKVFQAIKSKRPVFGLLHTESSALPVLKELSADQYTVAWNEALDPKSFFEQTKDVLVGLINELKAWSPDYKILEAKYSARESARKLTQGIDRLLRTANRYPDKSVN